MTTKRIIDEKYIAHIRDEVKQLKELKQKDRLEAWMNCQALMGVTVNHTKSLILMLSMDVLLNGLFTDLTDNQFDEIVNSLQDLAIHVLKVDKKLTELIPTADPEQLKVKPVHAQGFNPLVS